MSRLGRNRPGEDLVLGDPAFAYQRAIQFVAGAPLSREKTNLPAADSENDDGLRAAIAQFHTAIDALRNYAVAHCFALAPARKGQKEESGREFHKAAEPDSHLHPA